MKDFAIKGDWEFLNTIKLIAETYGWEYCHEFNEFDEEQLNKGLNCLFFTTDSFTKFEKVYKGKLFSMSYVSSSEDDIILLDTKDFNKCEGYISENVKGELEMFVDWLHEKEIYDNIEWFYSLIKEFREK